jgi:hypothetical protein
VNFFEDTDAFVQANEVGAAAEEHVLAVVYDFANAGMQIRRGAATEISAAFDKLYAEASLGESTGSTDTGDSAA